MNLIIYKDYDIIEELEKIKTHHYKSSWYSDDYKRHKETEEMIEELIDNIKKAGEVMLKWK